MSNIVEQLDRARCRYLAGFIIALVFFLAFWFVRFFLRASGETFARWDVPLLIVLFCGAAAMGWFSFKLNYLRRRIKFDPSLAEALDNELVILNEIRSWRTAFIASIVCLVALTVLTFVYPVFDMVFVTITTCIVGMAAYNISFFVKDRG
jgi:divalent metal cation (Fe/Co/Zn/Cd) transporter